MIYGDPGSVIPLNLAAGVGDYQLSVPSGLPLARRIAVPGFRPASAGWRFNGAANFVMGEGDGLSSRVQLRTVGPGRATAGGMALGRDSFLQSGPLGLDFGTHADPARNQAPHRLRCSFRGIVPRADGALLFYMVGWGIGSIALTTRYGSDQLECLIGRGEATEGGFFSTAMRKPGVEQLLEVEWCDNVAGPGGTLSFLIDGKAAGGPFRTKLKPRITPEMDFSVNAALGNTRQAIDGMVVAEVSIGFDRPVADYRYLPVASGLLPGEELPDLVVDARTVTAPRPPQTLAWRSFDGGVATLDITVGPIDVPSGQAYKAVLVDWSSGAGVPHPNQLVMTRLAAQNCRFEDAWLGAAQPAWAECLPQGPVPVINGIAYRIEAIRSSDYVQFQFGYDWDESVMPANPFGDPSGRNAYMIPHKWLIYDRDEKLLATIETPDGGPLNGRDKMALYGGPSDGRGCAMTDGTHRWYPHGTVRSGIIWRSRDPGSHEQSGIRAAVPLFDLSIPFGCHLDYSVNGFDLRIFSGGAGNEGQANGFGNIRVIPWKQSDYRAMVGAAGRTRDPFTALYSANSLAANAALWLEYTPFNIQGRSPIAGPGGQRDDRQIIAEPVVWHMNLPDGRRPHDGTPWRTIALDYLTGYVSDPVHAFEKGRNVPLFKRDARRSIAFRNHYYGPGNLGLPANQAWYQQGGRVSTWIQGVNPLRVAAPYGGDVPERPYFGTFQIDKPHSHQFPGWGSLLFRSPEFAFLGHRFWDQNRLYTNDILGDPWLDLWSAREGAWSFLHAALAWKTASAGSQRLYSRAEVLDFVIFDFEQFHARHYASDPGFLHPPTNLMRNGQVDIGLAVYAAAPFFGVICKDDRRLFQHEFFIGYWLSAIAAGEKLGFNAALRGASAKAAAVLDWLIAMHRKRVVGRLLEGQLLPPIDGTSSNIGLWTADHIAAAGGEVARLPKSYAELEKYWGRTPSWDRYISDQGSTSRDGQAMDQLIAAPSLLRYLLGQSGDDLVAAQTVANGWREQKKAEELKKGERAGEGWFVYLQASNNPAKAVQS
ncbi:hypothetical protein [Rhizorhabdus dicambivorans]|uniref:Uncharacterized protein n=1 Tax=Rhizorhabdus dicambivorans TaxID=1850238 RepID=A0A2A4G3C5_9SPHN|nr:hypothetical protein [Rhizorhabdus dicambivorans]ATE65036.1 hypothetical protein CMV14_11985 [Rhizorhabdus dicambivorans]PCE44310.1 hypothetical protein COO09_01370 [Rhizorhabdus dicambivorans]